MKNLILVAAALASCALAQAQSRFALGVNLDNANAFVNMVNHTARYSKAVGFDSLGWPTSDFDLVLIDGRPATEWNGVIDDPEKYRIDYSGRYEGRFTGQATVRASGTSVSIENQAYDPSTNITTFVLVVGGADGPNHGLVFLAFTNTKRTPPATPNTGLTGLRINRPGYPLSTTQTFTNEYIRLCTAANFACYRFYNVQNIWDGEPTYPTRTTWTQRKSPSDAAQVSMAGMNGKRDGWCWEYIIELANILKKDVWLNIHMSCDSVYVASLAAMLNRDLDPSINIYIESSNEVWSPTQATHGLYNAAQAASRGITFDDNHAHRTVELSRWLAAALGSAAINERVRVIMAGQHAYHGRSDNHLRYIQRVFGEPKNFIYATSSALYFGSTNAGDANPTSINAGMLNDIDAQITNASIGTYRLNHINKAAQWQLRGGCTSYEGGPSIPEGGGTTNLASQIMANRTPAMSDVIKHNYLKGWRDLDGGLAMYFALSSGYNRYGCWGITDDPSIPDRNFKMQSLRDITGTSTSIEDAEVWNNTLFITYDSETRLAAISFPSPTDGASNLELLTLVGQRVGITHTYVSDTLCYVDLTNTPRGLYVVRVGMLTGSLLVW
ncbi:MAG: hypothetical protein NTX15_11690 [Candidatus Kapabacteria bacterium]|nr:hypothetical protein [Candidatus Kapabacteria bacterium]